jgi:two-component system, NarL family, invasion response regulator UvrY
MTPGKVKVLIADDHALLRTGLKRLLSEMPEVESVGEAEHGVRVLEVLQAEHWNILLLDLNMPGQGGLEVLARVKSDYPDVAVLILSMYPEEQFGLRAIKAGAAGYLPKDCGPEQLATAIRRVSAGGAYISAKLAAVLTRARQSQRAPREMLSAREVTVLGGIANGKSISAIAKDLNLSAKTVSTYRSRLLVRLNLHSNVELARYAQEQGLLG